MTLHSWDTPLTEEKETAFDPWMNLTGYYPQIELYDITGKRI